MHTHCKSLLARTQVQHLGADGVVCLFCVFFVCVYFCRWFSRVTASHRHFAEFFVLFVLFRAGFFCFRSLVVFSVIITFLSIRGGTIFARLFVTSSLAADWK